MKKVAVIAGYQTKFGELWEKSLRDLIADAGNGLFRDALKMTGINFQNNNKIDSMFVGNMAGGKFVGQDHVGAIAADVLGLKIPSTRCEGACASGALAFIQGVNNIASGKNNVCLVLGVEKMNDVSGGDVTTTLMGAGDGEWEAGVGLTFPGLYALMARAHMKKYGTTREQMAMVSVNNHKNGMNNENAQFRCDIKIENVLKASMVADPLTLLDCSPITDGAAALLIVSEDFVKENNIQNPVWVLGTGQGSDSVALHDRKSITTMSAVKDAGDMALKEADIDLASVDVLELHDCFSINLIIGIESLGFCPEGAGGKFVEDGKINLNGQIPINTTGGLKSIGHPVGATGVRQVIDVMKQLQGRSINQLNNVKIGMTLNVGGSGATAVVTVLSKDVNSEDMSVKKI